MPKLLRIILAAAGGVILLLAAIVVARALAPPAPEDAPPPPLALELDANRAALHLAEGVRFRTISWDDESGRSLDEAAFRGLHRYLEETYLLVHAKLVRETVAGFSLLYTWKGEDAEASPILLMGHTDVVPVEPGTEGEWEHPPFSGAIADGFIWGRGTLDDKVNVFGILEAAEHLLARGFQPQRTIYFAFGHDEELGGERGAAKIAEVLASRLDRLALVLDEGGAIADGLIPGLDQPLAAVGIAEKGYISVELLAEGESGHSSAPPSKTTVGIVASAVHRLERHQLPTHFNGPMRQLLEVIGPHTPFGYRLIFNNLWLFGPVVERVLLSMPQGNAALRTTTAATILQGGVKDNVLPSKARAVVNFRVYPGETADDVAEHVRAVVDDSRVQIRALPKQKDPSAFSRTDSEPFRLVQQTVRQIFPGTIVAPNLIPGGTDSRHFRSLSENVYGFTPMHIRSEDFKRLHGTNERIGVRTFADAVRFYAQLMSSAAGPVIDGR